MPSEEQKSLVTLPQRIATALEGVDSTERAFVKIFLELEKEKGFPESAAGFHFLQMRTFFLKELKVAENSQNYFNRKAGEQGKYLTKAGNKNSQKAKNAQEYKKCCKSMVVFLTGLCQEICEKHTDKQRSRCDFCFDRNDENAIQNYLKSGKALCDVRNLRRKLRTVLLGFKAKNSSIQRAKRNQN